VLCAVRCVLFRRRQPRSMNVSEPGQVEFHRADGNLKQRKDGSSRQKFWWPWKNYNYVIVCFGLVIFLF
jgi:hypothetical protein